MTPLPAVAPPPASIHRDISAHHCTATAGISCSTAMTYPYPCTHCGICCLAVPCPAATTFMGAKAGPCPALEWAPDNPDESRCGLIVRPEHYLDARTMDFIRREIPDLATMLGSGAGCCIKARLCGPDGPVDFAALPPEAKIAATRAVRANPHSLIPPPPSTPNPHHHEPPR